MVKKILGVLAGYTVYVVTSLALFKIAGRDPHQEASIPFIILTAIYGMIFSFVSGAIARMIAKTKALTVNYILALIIACFALFSLIKSEGAHWTQILSIVLFAPVSIAGGYFIRQSLIKRGTDN
jgi:hypothetical protein